MGKIYIFIFINSKFSTSFHMEVHKRLLKYGNNKDCSKILLLFKNTINILKVQNRMGKIRNHSGKVHYLKEVIALTEK